MALLDPQPTFAPRTLWSSAISLIASLAAGFLLDRTAAGVAPILGGPFADYFARRQFEILLCDARIQTRMRKRLGGNRRRAQAE